MKTIVRDQFKDNMDSVFEHLAGGTTGKVTEMHFVLSNVI